MKLLNLFSSKQTLVLANEVKYLSDENAQLQQSAEKYKEVFYQYLKGQPIYQLDNATNYITKGYQQNEDVYSIVSKIAQKCAMAPVILYEVKDEKALKQYKLKKQGNTPESYFDAMQLQKKALKEVEKHDILKVLDNPNNEESSFEFFMKAYIFMLVNGNQFFYGIEGAKKGLYNQLYNLPAHLTNIVGGDKFQAIKGYRCIWAESKLDFNPNEVKHVKYPGFDYDRQGGHLYGQSPLRVAIRNTISRMISSNEQLLRQAQNAGALGFVSNPSDTAKLSPEQSKGLEDKIKDRLMSNDAYNRFIVTNGDLKWNQIGFSAIDLDLLGLANFDAKKICNIYGYPIQLYNSESASTDNNMKWAAKNLINNVVTPIHHQFDDALNKWFVDPYSKKDGKHYHIEHDVYSYPEMSEDMTDMTNWLDKSWWISPNDKLEAQRYGRNADPNMDKVYIPSNLMPLENFNITEADFNKAFDEKGY